MDDNNNNQAPQAEETVEMTLPPVKNLDPKLFVAVVVLIIVVVGIVMTMLGKTQNSEPMPTIVHEVTPTVVTPTTPEKVSAGEALPEGFPKELILGQNTKITEGYSLDYEELMQKTATYSLASSSTEVYDQYLALLKKENWVIMNKYTSDNISSIYAVYRKEELNITIQKDENSEKPASLISISLLTK